VTDIRIKRENRLKQIMTMTPGESAKDKGTLFLELREICSYFHSEYSQSQVMFFFAYFFNLFFKLDTNKKFGRSFDCEQY
jgi:hypothetical protein